MELNRFRQLLESTMGNVKPLMSEAIEAAPAKTAYQSYAETRPYDIGKI